MAMVTLLMISPSIVSRAGPEAKAEDRKRGASRAVSHKRPRREPGVDESSHRVDTDGPRDGEQD